MSFNHFYRIDLPTKKYTGGLISVKVTSTSPKVQRQQVERFARYFLREMHNGHIQFCSAEKDGSQGFVPYEAYLLGVQDKYFGALCLRNCTLTAASSSWILDWVWLHPYFRHQGHLTQFWPTLKASHKCIGYSQPISPPMQRFLKKAGEVAA